MSSCSKSNNSFLPKDIQQLNQLQNEINQMQNEISQFKNSEVYRRFKEMEVRVNLLSKKVIFLQFINIFFGNRNGLIQALGPFLDDKDKLNLWRVHPRVRLPLFTRHFLLDNLYDSCDLDPGGSPSTNHLVTKYQLGMFHGHDYITGFLDNLDIFSSTHLKSIGFDNFFAYAENVIGYCKYYNVQKKRYEYLPDAESESNNLKFHHSITLSEIKTAVSKNRSIERLIFIKESVPLQPSIAKEMVQLFCGLSTLKSIEIWEHSCTVKMESPSQSGQTFEIGFDSKLFQFSWDQPVITIGRASECDINQKNAIGYNDVCGFSRLHLLIFPLPHTGQLILVDVGSYSGFITKWRSRSDRIKVCSRNFDRQNMLLESGESAVVWVGNFKLVLAPKGCVVCWSRVREIRFRECGHLVCCKNCIKVVHLCPICRAEIVKENYKIPVLLKSEDEDCQTFLCLPNDK